MAEEYNETSARVIKVWMQGPRSVDGRVPVMSDEKFVARLCQHAAEQSLGTAARKLIVDEVEALGQRLDNLNSLSLKGVHAEVTAAEVDQGLIQTYTLVGDFLCIADEKSAGLA
jgi:hypothetical protein